MYTRSKLQEDIENLGIASSDTLLVHSSMKAVGEVENGAETVLDAFIYCLRDGLLVFPTHTWDKIGHDTNIFDPLTEPSCVGILTNLFMKRPGVVRSWHPTHSVAALGRGAEDYVAGEENYDTPCSRNGCWGKLYDLGAKVLFLGCGLTKNTLIHGVEEWNHIPNRLLKKPRRLKIRKPDGTLLNRPMHGHYHPSGDVSHNYGKLEAPLLYTGIAQKGKIGDAVSVLCDIRRMVDLTSSFLKRNPDLFLDSKPVPEEWYK